MNYHFNSLKATEVAALLISKEPGQRINVMKLIKLIYLIDRLSISQRGLPVVGGVYYSMRNGPVTSELLDLVNAGKLAGEEENSWDRFLSDRDNHEIALAGNPGASHLSESEIQLVDEVFAEHGAKDQWQLRDWCHEHCGEWIPLQAGRERITLEDIALNTGCTASTAKRLSEEAAEANLLARALTLG